MINAIIIDKNKNICDVLADYLKDNVCVKLSGCYETFSQLTNANYDLIIFDVTTSDYDNCIKYVQEIKKINHNAKFIAISYEMGSNFISNILSNGVDDFLLKPILKNILEISINKVFLTPEDKNIVNSKAISIFSSKGGIGKTSAALNLAYEISKNIQKNVCLLDLSLNNDNCSQYLGTQAVNYDFIASVIKEGNKDFVYSLIPKFEDSKLYVLSFKEDISINQKITPKNIQSLINSLKNMFDYVIIDTSNFFDEKLISILNSTNLVLYLTLLNENAINSTLKGYEIIKKAGYNENYIKIIANRTMKGSIKEKEILEDKIDQKILYEIPNNYITLMDSINQAKPLGITNPKSNIAKAFVYIAQEIIKSDMASEISNNCTIFNLFQRMGE